MTARGRNAALTAHVVASVGWLGAIATFLALSIVGLTSEDPETVRAAYLVMDPAAWYVLVPLAVASLATGLVQSFVTSWGLFRHYWVVFKLVINLGATIVLLMYMETFRFMADVAADSQSDLGTVRTASPLLHSALALSLLVAATILAVFKPRGVTPYGRRKQRRATAISETRAAGEHHG